MVHVPVDSIANYDGHLHIQTNDGQSVIATKYSITDTSVVVTQIKTLDALYAREDIPPRTILFENIGSLKHQEHYWKRKSNTEIVLTELLEVLGSGAGF